MATSSDGIKKAILQQDKTPKVWILQRSHKNLQGLGLEEKSGILVWTKQI